MNSRLMSTRDAAESLGVSPQTVMKLTRLGELRVVRIGSRTLYRPADVEDYVERHARLIGAMGSE